MCNYSKNFKIAKCSLYSPITDDTVSFLQNVLGEKKLTAKLNHFEI